MFDSIVIGGGIAGLYAAMKLCARGDHVIVLERDDEFGGRAKTDEFCGVRVVTGAGIGRKDKDWRLQSLLDTLRVPATAFPVRHAVSAPLGPCSAADQFHVLKAEYATRDDARTDMVTFRDFGQEVLGNQAYAQMVQCSGFSDFEDAAVRDVFYHYGFDDNVTDWTGLSIPWNQVIETMCKVLDDSGRCLLCVGCPVDHLTVGKDVKVRTEDGGVIRGRRVYIATEISTVQTLLRKEPMYKCIHAQPFFRLYASFSGASAEVMGSAVQGVTIVGSPLQKMIPMSDTVYMVAYCDNEDALFMRHVVMTTPGSSIRSTIARFIEQGLGLRRKCLRVDALHEMFFESGTHYNAPALYNEYKHKLSVLQHPVPRVFVVGEAVSTHQGWVEGALESVDAVLK
jgi:hypothetical protein